MRCLQEILEAPCIAVPAPSTYTDLVEYIWQVFVPE